MRIWPAKNLVPIVESLPALCTFIYSIGVIKSNTNCKISSIFHYLCLCTFTVCVVVAGQACTRANTAKWTTACRFKWDKLTWNFCTHLHKQKEGGGLKFVIVLRRCRVWSWRRSAAHFVRLAYVQRSPQALHESCVLCGDSWTRIVTARRHNSAHLPLRRYVGRKRKIPLRYHRLTSGWLHDLR